jgi:pSer/pThr/pTyr-binding forkhead associated (FHA) protein
MSKLRIRNGPFAGREVTLDRGVTIIGRESDAPVQVLDRNASRQHAEVFPVGEMYFVRDLGSKNGTHLNEQPLTQEELLRVGDVIRIGTTEIIFEGGVALAAASGDEAFNYDDSNDYLNNTIEYRLDDLEELVDAGSERRRNEHESRSLRLLYRVGRLIAESSPGEIAANILDLLLEALPAEHAILFQRQRNAGKLVPICMRHTSGADVAPTISRTIIKRVMSENRAIFLAPGGNRPTESLQGHVERSIICVPINLGGTSRGVIYLTRAPKQGAFTHADVELLSACAVSIALSIQIEQQLLCRQQGLWAVLSCLVSGIESQANAAGIGRDTVAASLAIGQGLQIAAKSRWRLQVASILARVESWVGGNERLLDSLQAHDLVEPVLPLVRLAFERLDGQGPNTYEAENLGVEERILSAAVAFVDQRREHPEEDTIAIFDRMLADPGYDEEIVMTLRSAHMDGSLYRVEIG